MPGTGSDVEADAGLSLTVKTVPQSWKVGTCGRVTARSARPLGMQSEVSPKKRGQLISIDCIQAREKMLS